MRKDWILGVKSKSLRWVKGILGKVWVEKDGFLIKRSMSMDRQDVFCIRTVPLERKHFHFW